MLIVRVVLVVGFIVLTSGSSFSQIFVSDDFSDGDHSANPTWVGDSGFFGVDPSGQLVLQDSIAGSRFLSLQSEISLSASWQWSCSMQFNPSSSNYLKVYLTSNRSNLKGPLEGYFVRMGGSSEDRISLYRQSGNSEYLITESVAGWVDASDMWYRVKVERDEYHNWSVWVDTTAGGSYSYVAGGVDSSVLASRYFGILPTYTKTRADRFYFDDFNLSGNKYLDTIPPELLGVQIPDSVSIELTFSEALDSTVVNVGGKYILSDGILITFAHLIQSQKVALRLSNTLTRNQAYSLMLSQIPDLSGNTKDTVLIIRRIVPQAFDIQINEIMADPEPSVGIPPWNLPEVEYIELRNQLPWDVSLDAWKIKIEGKAFEIPQMHIPSSSHVLLVNENLLDEFNDSLNIVGLDIPLNALLNQGATMELVDHRGVVISQVSYNPDFYRNMLKAQGGWSMERIDPYIRCNDHSNWTASEDQNGGTPARPNSISASSYDAQVPTIKSLILNSYDNISLIFTGSMNSDPALLESGINLISDVAISKAEWIDGDATELSISFDQNMEQDKVYELQITADFESCSGVKFIPESLYFGIPRIPAPGDILINEVLFDPVVGSVDFVEIINVSNHIIDLSSLRIGNWDTVWNQVTNSDPVSKRSELLLPGEIISLSEIGNSLAVQFPRSANRRHVMVSKMPVLGNESGSFGIETNSFLPIDHMTYDADMHHPFLNDPEGVSLERISVLRSSQERENWHSAGSLDSYGTPGYQNSQSENASVHELLVNPKVFSPNLDGIDDFVAINFSSNHTGLFSNAFIFSSDGHMVKTLAEQVLLGKDQFLSWDGTDDDGDLQKPGIYIVVLETYAVNEKRKVYRGTCVLSP